MDPISEKIIDRRRNHRIAAGVILVLFGLATLLQRWLDIGNYIVLLLGCTCLASELNYAETATKEGGVSPKRCKLTI